MNKLRQPEDLEIRTGNYNNLWIAKDYHEDQQDEEVAMLTFTPKATEFEHYHIQLDVEQLQKIKIWIDEFLELYAK